MARKKRALDTVSAIRTLLARLELAVVEHQDAIYEGEFKKTERTENHLIHVRNKVEEALVLLCEQGPTPS